MTQAWQFGADLVAAHWPAQQPRARVLVAHGLGEHIGRYARLTAALNAASYDVYGYDQRGHGQSGGPRALVRLDELVADHLKAREALLTGDLPLFAFGHSLGGLVTAASVARDPRGLSGVILSSPALVVDHGLSPGLRALVRLLARVAPGLSNKPIPAAHLASDAGVGQAYDADPLVHHGGVRIGTADSMIRTGAALWPRLARWRLPTLLIQGDADRLVSVEGARRFARETASDDLTYIEEPGGYHELFNDVNSSRFTELLTGWLDART